MVMQNSNQDQTSRPRDAGKKNDQVAKQNQGSKQDQVAEQDVSGAKTAPQKQQQDKKDLAQDQTNQTNPKLNPIHNNLETNKG